MAEAEIIVENDELEDGSIFVCFMCEKEFKKVSLLNEHMKLHQNLPEMSPELPKRQRGGKRQGSSSTRGSRGRGRGRGNAQIETGPVISSVIGGAEVITEIKTEEVLDNRMQFVDVDTGTEHFLSGLDANDIVRSKPSISKPSVSKPVVKTTFISRKQQLKTPNKDIVVIKEEDEPKSDAVKKAERIKHFFQSRYMMKAKEKPKRLPSFDEDTLIPDFDVDNFEIPMEEDEIMMVPPPAKKSAPTKSSSKSSQPLLSSDPEGFHIPPPIKKAKTYAQRASSPASITSRPFSPPPILPSSSRSSAVTNVSNPTATKPPKKVKLRKKLIVQEIVYEEVEESDEEGEGDSQPSAPPRVIKKVVSSTPVSIPLNAQRTLEQALVKRQPRGRGRPKRFEQMEMDMDDDEDEIDGNFDDHEVAENGEMIEVYDFNPPRNGRGAGKMPGRRSQPRHSEEGPGIPCEECGKEFRSVTTLRVHLKSHFETKDIPCPYCDEVFPQRHILYQHLVSDHEESDNLTCNICFKVFTRTDSLNSHMVRMHERDGGLNCYICGKNFPSQGQLEMHVRVHTGERPFKCDFCGKGFVQKVHLRTHLRTMHNCHELQTTPCRICNAMLDGRAGLRDHFNTVHGLTSSQYKTHVAKLRKEGKIPEVPPPVVKEVDPSLNYCKVSVSELTKYDNPTVSSEKPKTVRKLPKVKPGRKPRVAKETADVETTIYCDADSTYGSSDTKIELEEGPRPRDQEELNIVESAFKVAEQMDQLGNNTPASTTILVAGEDSERTGVYYAIPVVVDGSGSCTASASTTSTFIQAGSTSSHQDPIIDSVTSTVTSNGTPIISATVTDSSELHFADEEMDEEYAQFAAEHSHIDAEKFDSKGSIVKAEALHIFSDPDDPSTADTVEMFTM